MIYKLTSSLVIFIFRKSSVSSSAGEASYVVLSACQRLLTFLSLNERYFSFSVLQVFSHDPFNIRGLNIHPYIHVWRLGQHENVLHLLHYRRTSSLVKRFSGVGSPTQQDLSIDSAIGRHRLLCTLTRHLNYLIKIGDQSWHETSSLYLWQMGQNGSFDLFLEYLKPHLAGMWNEGYCSVVFADVFGPLSWIGT